MAVKVGDWIRFMVGGRLVIDEVAYVIPHAVYDSTPEAMTLEHGRVACDDIMEVRTPKRRKAALEG